MEERVGGEEFSSSCITSSTFFFGFKLKIFLFRKKTMTIGERICYKCIGTFWYLFIRIAIFINIIIIQNSNAMNA